MPLVNEILSYYIIWMFYTYSDVPVIIIILNYSCDFLTLVYLLECKISGRLVSLVCVCKDLLRDSYWESLIFPVLAFSPGCGEKQQQEESCSNHGSKECAGLGNPQLWESGGMPITNYNLRGLQLLGISFWRVLRKLVGVC